MEPGPASAIEAGSPSLVDTIPPSDDGHRLFLEMYKRESGQTTWDRVDWKNLPYSDYAGRYISEHAYSYYIEGSKDAREGMEEYLCLVASPGFRQFRKEKMNSIDGAAIPEDLRRALRVYYVKWCTERNSTAGDFQSVEKAWNAANRAMSQVNRIQATYGRSDNPLLVDLERKLCESREDDDPYKPLYDFWASYYPALFPKSHSASPSTTLYERKVSQLKS
jgi:hypothetical protein